MTFAQLLRVNAEIGALELLRIQSAEADLIELRAFVDPDTEAARRDFGIEWSLIPAPHAVEHIRFVGDEAGKNIEAAG